MTRILISVEGQTEETFVRDLLKPHLDRLGVFLQPVVLATKRPSGGGKYRGGLTSWKQARAELVRLLTDTSVLVTTMYDLYALPGDFPGRQMASGRSPRERVQAVQHAVDSEIGSARLRSYVQLHEFESLVLSCAGLLGDRSGDERVGELLEQQVQAAGGPEFVNDGPTTAPSKRIASSWPGYVKTLDGPAVLAEAGLASIRVACPHFDEWITWLEQQAG